VSGLFDIQAASPALQLALAAGLLGVAAGWLIERTHFCTMGAISDAYLFGSWRRLRAWCLAVATALLLTQLLALSGLVPLAEAFYLAPRIEILGLLVGGILFGIGMVLAGGCASRNLVRLGGGSLKALVVLLMLGLTAFATLAGVLVLPAGLLRGAVVWTVDQPTQSLGAFLAAAGIVAQPVADAVLGLGLGAMLLLFVFKDARFRRSRADQALGFGLGTLVALGFLVTGWLLADPFEPVAVVSLAYVAPTARTLLWTMTGHGLWPGFGAALALGTVLGAALSAGLGGRFRVETFRAADDMIRHVAGGALMGFGGILALGCTVGQGMTGLATLALGSFIAVAGIVMGALLALRRLERGSWRAAFGLKAESGPGAVRAETPGGG
jgi:uncharacterized membrane protein YedE/YeeE